jgi:hypothetical protein
VTEKRPLNQEDNHAPQPIGVLEIVVLGKRDPTNLMAKENFELVGSTTIPKVTDTRIVGDLFGVD